MRTLGAFVLSALVALWAADLGAAALRALTTSSSAIAATYHLLRAVAHAARGRVDLAQDAFGRLVLPASAPTDELLACERARAKETERPATDCL